MKNQSGLFITQIEQSLYAHLYHYFPVDQNLLLCQQYSTLKSESNTPIWRLGETRLINRVDILPEVQKNSIRLHPPFFRLHSSAIPTRAIYSPHANPPRYMKYSPFLSACYAAFVRGKAHKHEMPLRCAWWHYA
jgi:hypothetical protein